MVLGSNTIYINEAEVTKTLKNHCRSQAKALLTFRQLHDERGNLNVTFIEITRGYRWKLTVYADIRSILAARFRGVLVDFAHWQRRLMTLNRVLTISADQGSIISQKFDDATNKAQHQPRHIALDLADWRKITRVSGEDHFASLHIYRTNEPLHSLRASDRQT